MIDSDFYLLIAFGVVLVGVMVVGHSRSKRLPPRRRALSELYFEFLFSGLVACGIVYVLLFKNYVPRIYSENPTVEQLTETINALRDSFETLKYTLYLGLMLVLINLLKAIYAFARTLTPPEEAGSPGSGNDRKKPILGLNDEAA